MTTWRRRVVVIGALAVVFWVAMVIWHWPYEQAWEEVATDCFDDPGEPVYWWRWTRIWVFWALLAPGWALIGTPGQIAMPWISGVVWAIVLYGVWAVATATRRWWRAR